MSPAAENEPIGEEKLQLLFALLFSSPEPVTQDRIREVLYPTQPEDEEPVKAETHSPRQHLEALETWMLGKKLPLQLSRVGRSWRILTSPEFAEPLASIRRSVHKNRLGPAALEVLSLVAYRQPVLKADVDAIRGVNSGPHLRHLLDMRLVRILGRAEVPGRPFLYATTREFLDHFGLRDIDDLPEAGRLSVPAEVEPAEEMSDEPAAVPETEDVPEEVPASTSIEEETAPGPQL